eukprot:Em0005g488a
MQHFDAGRYHLINIHLRVLAEVAFDKRQKKERGYSIVVVVSPLVAIMKDQVSTYSIKGLKTTYVSGEVTDKSVLDEVSQGNFQLVFFTPEMLIGRANNLQATAMRSLEVAVAVSAITYFVNPQDAPDIPEFRLCDMFTIITTNLKSLY